MTEEVPVTRGLMANAGLDCGAAPPLAMTSPRTPRHGEPRQQRGNPGTDRSFPDSLMERGEGSLQLGSLAVYARRYLPVIAVA